MQDQNPYAAPQTVISSSAGEIPMADLQLSPEFFRAAAGGKNCFMAICIFIVSLICTIALMFATGPGAAFLLFIGGLVSMGFYFAGLNQLRKLPAETGAQVSFTSAFIMFVIYCILLVITTFLMMSMMREAVFVRLVYEFLQMLIVIATLIGQRRVGRYTSDAKLLSYNLYAAIGYGVLTITGFVLLFLAISDIIDLDALRRQNDDKMIGLAIAFLFFVLTAVVVFLYGYANAFKRISEFPREQFMKRRTTSAIGLPGQNRDNNQFDFLR